MFSWLAKLFQPRFHNIDVASVKLRKKEGWDPFIIDVRSISEARGSGVIPGTKFVQPHSKIMQKSRKIPSEGDILIYCQSGMRSKSAINTLLANGYDGQRIYNLSGGMMAFQRSGSKTKKF